AAYLQDGANEGSNIGTDDGTIGIGKESEASYGAVAIGQISKAKARHNIAIGYGADSGTQVNSLAIGYRTAVSGAGAIALGKEANSTNSQTIAIGSDSKASHNESIALGGQANATHEQAIAIGSQSKASGEQSIVLGTGASVTGTQTIVIGSRASASGHQSVAIGANTQAQGYGSISIGGDDLATTKYQANDRDYSETTIARGNASVAIGGRSSASGDGSIVVGPLASATHAEGIAIGARSRSNNEYGIAVGGSASADGKNAVALGRESRGAGTDSIAIGNSARTTGVDSVVVGAHINVTGQKSVAVGRQANARDYSTALGYMASASGTYSVAVGENAMINVNAARATALGHNTVVTVGGGVALGYGSNASIAGGVVGLKQAHSVTTGESTDANGFKSTQKVDGNNIGAVSVGGTTIKRQIVNVAAGKELTDAVNVAQLKSLTMKIGGDTNDNTQPKVGLWDGILKVLGTNGEIKTNASNSTITISLDDTIKNKLADARAGSLIFKGEKTDNGTTNDVLGQKWKANEDKTVTIKSDETYHNGGVRYKGDNIEIYRRNLEFHVLMKETPTFSSVQYGDNGPKITSTTDGNLKVTGTDGTSSVKITNLKAGTQNGDAVNYMQFSNAGWKLAIAPGTGGQAARPAAHLIKINDTVTFTAGNNIKLEQAGGNITISTIGKLIKTTERQANGDLKITYTDNSHDIINKGEKGYRGERGLRGETGPAGPAGPRGPVGQAGARGEPGPRGERGIQGPAGERGPAGVAGPKGEKGDPGPKGEAGPTGPRGPVGPQGPQGKAGAQGQKGERGEPGQTGPAGPRGPVGPMGPRGDRGETGPAGPTGAKGEQGQK
ncbi:hypothetical protein F9858_10815, partial [Glaesserella parasuis]|nr:hypothetical protein [Glaesserella parasuis]